MDDAIRLYLLKKREDYRDGQKIRALMDGVVNNLLDYRYNSLENDIREIKGTILAIQNEIQIIKKRIEHHINLRDAHKEPIRG